MLIYFPINGDWKLTLFCGRLSPMVEVTTKMTNSAVTKMAETAIGTTIWGKTQLFIVQLIWDKGIIFPVWSFFYRLSIQGQVSNLVRVKK